METLLDITFFLIIGIIYFCPLFLGFLTICSTKLCRKTLPTYLLGMMLATITYSILYYAIATISHSQNYSQAGLAFSAFYREILYGTTIVVTLGCITILLAHVCIHNTITKMLAHIVYGYQLMLCIFVLVPDVWLGQIFDILNFHDIAIAVFKYFSNYQGGVDIYLDLVNTNYSATSFLILLLFLMVTNGIVLIVSGG